jgi:hypothetical protein
MEAGTKDTISGKAKFVTLADAIYNFIDIVTVSLN